MQSSGSLSEHDVSSRDGENETFSDDRQYEDEAGDTASSRVNDPATGSVSDADGKKPPGLSYIALISMAIQSNADKKMLLSEIYAWISARHPYYQMKDKSWRNSIRHNLSLNECFVKNGRSENGKGNYWSIHPANIDDFSKGDYRRRRARRRVRKCDEDLQRLCSNVPSPSPPPLPRQMTSPKEAYGGYVPMISTLVPSNFLSALGVDQLNSCDDWAYSAHAPYTGYTTNAQPDYNKYGSKNFQPHEPYIDSQYFPSFWDGTQHKSNYGPSSYMGQQQWGNTRANVPSPQNSESTFNVNVNVNVCGNAGISQQHASQVFSTTCVSPRP